MILDFIFPRICVWCWEKWEYLCNECKKQIEAHPEMCPFCHKKSNHFQTCYECKESQILQWIVIWFAYKTAIKKLVLNAKFAHKKDTIWFLSKKLSLIIQTNQFLQDIIKKNKLFISYIPSHRKRHYFEKWYNQSQLLAEALAKDLNISMLKLAKKKKYTVSQLRLNREQRKKNLNNVFVVQNLNKIPLNSTILLVDDVTTTGSTLSELAKTIHSKRSDLQFRWAVICRNMW